MKKNMKCLECGRSRKPSHEKRCGTPKAYSPKCKTYEDFDYKEYLQAILDAKAKEEAEAKAKEAEIKRVEEINAKVEAEAVATGGIGEATPNIVASEPNSTVVSTV